MGGAGIDFLWGNDGDDILDGGDGNDRLIGGAGNDVMIGGAGDDIYYVDDAGDIVIEAFDEGTDKIISSIDYTLGDNVGKLNLTGIVGLTGTGNGLNNAITGTAFNDTMFGMDGNDDLWGGGGNDTLNGGNGNDRLLAGLGADTMTGGLGNDAYFVDDIGDQVIELAGEGADRIVATIDYTLGDHIETLELSGNIGLTGTGNALDNLVKGTNYDDTLFGMEGNDSLNGKDGDDTLYGGGGNDIIFGGTGDDTMYGGDGDDVYMVDTTADSVVEVIGEGSDLVRSTLSYMLGDNLENLRLEESGGAISGTGNALNNRIWGNSSNNTLDGGAGTDNLYAGSGDDIVIGGSGNDQLLGNDGADTLIGGIGNDTFIGGSGADIIELEFGSGSDTMTDFEDGLDLIDLSATGLTFADLTIVNSSNGVLISFDDSDNLTPVDDLDLVGLTSSSITADDFIFV